MINKVILIGNVGKEPEIRYIENGVAVARFTLATTERGFTTSNGTSVPERTEWHNIVLWRNLAEIAEKYVHKGSQVYIEGKITYRSWTDKANITRYTTEIVADTMQLLGKKSDNAAAAAANAAATPKADPETAVDNLPPATKDDVNGEPF